MLKKHKFKKSDKFIDRRIKIFSLRKPTPDLDVKGIANHLKTDMTRKTNSVKRQKEAERESSPKLMNKTELSEDLYLTQTIKVDAILSPNVTRTFMLPIDIPCVEKKASINPERNQLSPIKQEPPPLPPDEVEERLEESSPSKAPEKDCAPMTSAFRETITSTESQLDKQCQNKTPLIRLRKIHDLTYQPPAALCNCFDCYLRSAPPQYFYNWPHGSRFQPPFFSPPLNYCLSRMMTPQAQSWNQPAVPGHMAGFNPNFRFS